MDNELSPREVATAIAGTLAEWLFAMLPLVVVAIVTLNFGTFCSVLFHAVLARVSFAR